MKSFSRLFLLPVIVLSVLVSGCSNRLGDFTIISTKNYERNIEYKNVGRFEGKDKVLIILGIPLGVPTFEDAVDNALEAGGGVYLANAVIEYSGWFAILIGQQGYTCEGDVFAPVSRGAILDDNEERFSLIETEDGPAMKSSLTGELVPVQDITHMVTAE